MKKILAAVILTTLSYAAKSQGYWFPYGNTGKKEVDKAALAPSFPRDYKLFMLDAGALKQSLLNAVGRPAPQPVVISLPGADGKTEQFELYEASNFEPALQEQFPEIRSFSGRGLTDNSATVRMSFSPEGLQTMVFRPGRENEYIEAYSADRTVYAVFKAQQIPGARPFNCKVKEKSFEKVLNAGVAQLVARGGQNMKTLRLVVSAQAEYSNYFGAYSAADAGKVLAAVNATLTRINGIFERDHAVHFNLMANTTKLFYYNPSTDPYHKDLNGNWDVDIAGDVGAGLMQSIIGNAGYDIGHVFLQQGDGGSTIGSSICDIYNKGNAASSSFDGTPTGYDFDVAMLAHEMGHQLGAEHTYSHDVSDSKPYEPGSGHTIMSYAGITNENIAPTVLDLFHPISIQEVTETLNAKGCPVTITTAIGAPQVAAGADYTIPKSTPFVLKGAGQSNWTANAPTYSWDQMDAADAQQTGANSKAYPEKPVGPNWISLRPTTSPSRTFPKLETILAGKLISDCLPGGTPGFNSEALSSVGRKLNFRLTMRDNAPYRSTAPYTIGHTSYDDAVVTVASNSGPFQVTRGNSPTTWQGASIKNISWSVNNTTAAPVSCSSVNILLSTDGGNSFTMLLANTANDGQELVLLPNIATTRARIKVEAVGNIFFDISNADVTITQTVGCGVPSNLSVASITANSAKLQWEYAGNAVHYWVEYKASSSASWIIAAQTVNAASFTLTGLRASTKYDWRVRSNCTGGGSNFAQGQFTTKSALLGTAKINDEPVSATAAAGVSVFPNPAANKVVVNVPEMSGSAQLRVIDMYGKVVKTHTVTGKNTELDISSLPAGAYLIKVIMNGKEETVKFIRN